MALWHASKGSTCKAQLVGKVIHLQSSVRLASLISKTNGAVINKAKFIDIYLEISDLYNTEALKGKFSILEANTRYSILFRVCYGDAISFIMLGNQVAFHTSYDPIVMQDKLTNLSDLIIYRLKASMDQYGYKGEEITTIQLLVYKVSFTD